MIYQFTSTFPPTLSAYLFSRISWFLITKLSYLFLIFKNKYNHNYFSLKTYLNNMKVCIPGLGPCRNHKYWDIALMLLHVRLNENCKLLDYLWWGFYRPCICCVCIEFNMLRGWLGDNRIRCIVNEKWKFLPLKDSPISQQNFL